MTSPSLQSNLCHLGGHTAYNSLIVRLWHSANSQHFLRKNFKLATTNINISVILHINCNCKSRFSYESCIVMLHCTPRYIYTLYQCSSTACRHCHRSPWQAAFSLVLLKCIELRLAVQRRSAKCSYGISPRIGFEEILHQAIRLHSKPLSHNG